MASNKYKVKTGTNASTGADIFTNVEEIAVSASEDSLTHGAPFHRSFKLSTYGYNGSDDKYFLSCKASSGSSVN